MKLFKDNLFELFLIGFLLLISTIVNVKKIGIGKKYDFRWMHVVVCGTIEIQRYLTIIILS